MDDKPGIAFRNRSRWVGVARKEAEKKAKTSKTPPQRRLSAQA